MPAPERIDPAPRRVPPRAIDIVKRFGDFTANDRVTLRLPPGEIHALLGENGAGKSTLVKIVYGALQPTDGQLRWRGETVEVPNPAAARRLGIGMVFQHFSLFEALTVAENIALALPGAFDLGALGERIARVSAEYGLPLEPNALVADLSVGERQRIEIVRCLLQEPRLLIMDEPTAVLTPQEADQLFVTLRRLAGEGCAVLYISHRLEEVKQLCHHATILRHGKVVANVDPKAETAASLARLMVGADVHAVSAEAHAPDGPPMLALAALSLPADGPFGSGATRRVARSARGRGGGDRRGGGQRAVRALRGAVGRAARPATPDAVTIAGEPCGTRGVTARRRLGAAFVPEERLGHSAVPGFVLSDNVLLTRHAIGRRPGARRLHRPAPGPARWRTASWNGSTCARAAPTRRRGRSPAAISKKFVVGRELDREPAILVINQPTWGVDAGAAALIRQVLLGHGRDRGRGSRHQPGSGRDLRDRGPYRGDLARRALGGLSGRRDRPRADRPPDGRGARSRAAWRWRDDM